MVESVAAPKSAETTLQFSPSIVRLNHVKNAFYSSRPESKVKIDPTQITKDQQKAIDEGTKIHLEEISISQIVDHNFDKTKTGQARTDAENNYKKLKKNVLEWRGKNEGKDMTVALAKAIKFARENMGANRSWEAVMNTVKVYPEALQDDQFRNELILNLKQEIPKNGVKELVGTTKRALLKSLSENVQYQSADQTKTVGEWSNFVDGQDLFVESARSTKIFAETFDAGMVANMIQIPDIGTAQVEAVMNELKIFSLSRDNVGQIMARLSHSDKVPDDQKDNLRWKALGYAHALVDAARQRNDDSFGVNMEVNAIKTIVEVAGTERDVNTMINQGGDSLALAVGELDRRIMRSEKKTEYQKQNDRWREASNKKRQQQEEMEKAAAGGGDPRHVLEEIRNG